MTRPEVIVIGLGAVGSATAWQLARRGVKVLGIDRWHPPHAMGSTHGETRITRTAIGEGEQFVPLVRRSDEIWAELEERNGPLGLRCGALIIGAEGGSTVMHGRPGFVAGTVAAAQAFGVPYEVLTAAECRRRFPAFHPADSDLVYYEPGAGMLFPERCVVAQLDAAREAGAMLRTGEQMLRYENISGGVRITTDKGVYEAAEAVLAAGAWSPGFAPTALARTSVTRQLLHWLQPQHPALFEAGRCPVYIWAHGPTSDDSFYGFPLVPGAEANGVKIADEQFLNPIDDPDHVNRDSSDAETDALHADHLDGRLSGLGRTALRRATCLYTSTADAGFILDRLPGTDAITLVSACSGHGFKHSAAVGEQVALMVHEGRRTPPEGFSPAAA
ncbi:N-methyl-L-tryptophan oxidase [Sandaracinobacter neustonicus]|uniref:N-methyl-L-tryptophan oxidase n=1 Tax=Sandaracinobacter neustonicus TaxID=1715348 RepID=A0A501XJ80_9SPHN|nr:N-methyl-L-tryptophan oxidase [Sandaracinobacter neustonicus]TPE60606.1 N-methyl-L-tryptophan oxidase [Sandaracinobacter neustonicus]